MTLSNRQKIAVALGLLISVFFLWIAFSGLQPEKVLAYIGEVDIWLLLVSVAVFMVAVWAITWRWQLLLRTVQPVSQRYLFELVNIGYMGNNVYPFRSGEILRVLLLYRAERIPISQSATTVLVERVFDGIVMLSFIIVPLALADFASPEVSAAAGVAAPLFAVALLVFLLLAARPDWLRRVVGWFARLLPGRVGAVVLRLTEGIVDGLAGLRSPLNLLLVVASSYLTWLISGVVYWLVALAFGLDIGLMVALIAVGAVNLAGLIPASPGQIGVFEFFASRVVMSAGVPEAQALAYALLLHVVIWLPPTLLGFLYLIRQGLSLADVASAQKAHAESQP